MLYGPNDAEGPIILHEGSKAVLAWCATEQLPEEWWGLPPSLYPDFDCQIHFTTSGLLAWLTWSFQLWIKKILLYFEHTEMVSHRPTAKIRMRDEMSIYKCRQRSPAGSTQGWKSPATSVCFKKYILLLLNMIHLRMPFWIWRWQNCGIVTTNKACSILLKLTNTWRSRPYSSIMSASALKLDSGTVLISSIKVFMLVSVGKANRCDHLSKTLN